MVSTVTLLTTAKYILAPKIHAVKICRGNIAENAFVKTMKVNFSLYIGTNN